MKASSIFHVYFVRILSKLCLHQIDKGFYYEQQPEEPEQSEQPEPLKLFCQNPKQDSEKSSKKS